MDSESRSLKASHRMLLKQDFESSLHTAKQLQVKHKKPEGQYSQERQTQLFPWPLEAGTKEPANKRHKAQVQSQPTHC